MRRSTETWTVGQLNKLRKEYLTIPVAVLANKLGKTPYHVNHKAKELGLMNCEPTAKPRRTVLLPTRTESEKVLKPMAKTLEDLEKEIEVFENSMTDIPMNLWADGVSRYNALCVKREQMIKNQEYECKRVSTRK